MTASMVSVKEKARCSVSWIPYKQADVRRWWDDLATYLLNLFQPDGPKRLTDVDTGDET